MLGRIMFVTSKYGGIFPGLYNSLKRMKVDFIETPIWNMEESYEKFNPQVIIFFHHFIKEFTDEMERLDKLSCHKVYWEFENPWEIDYTIQIAPHFSFVFTQDRTSMAEINSFYNGKAIYVPHAADPESCKKVNVPFQFRSDLCFIGAAYPSRLKFFREVLPQLKDYKVIIGGTGWEFLPDIQGQKIINTGVDSFDYVRYVQGAKVNVNLHRLSDEMPIANKNNIQASSPNNRFFEIYMCGGFQLVDSVRPDLEQFYPDVHSFSSVGEFIEMFHYWTELNEARKREAKDMYEQTLEKHTYERRFIDIISKVI
jgi:spore maturation protein CgeB